MIWKVNHKLRATEEHRYARELAVSSHQVEKAFEKVHPMDDHYSETLMVENDQEPGSGYAIWRSGSTWKATGPNAEGLRDLQKFINSF